MSNVKRKDSKNRNLRNGESQRKDGRYVYKYTDIYGKPQFIYLVLRQEKVQIKCNHFSLFLAKLNLLFLSHSLQDFLDILPHIDLGINIHNGCECVLYYKMFRCIQKSTCMHVYN